MKTPDFFAAIPCIRLRDPLADFLGAEMRLEFAAESRWHDVQQAGKRGGIPSLGDALRQHQRAVMFPRQLLQRRTPLHGVASASPWQ